MGPTLDVRIRADSSAFHGGLDKALREANSFAGKLSAQFNTLKNLAVGGAVGSFGLGIARDMFDAAVQAERLEAALGATAGSALLGKKQLADTRALAADIGLGLDEASKSMLQLQSAGMTTAEAMKTIRVSFNSILASGGGSNEFGRFAYGLQQVLSAGRPLQEDINILRESLPIVGGLMKETFGANRAEDLQKLGISGRQFVETLVAALEKLPQIGDTMSRQMGRFQSQLDNFRAAAGESFLPIVGGVMDRLTAEFKKLQDVSRGIADVYFRLVDGGDPESVRAQGKAIEKQAADRADRLKREKRALDEFRESQKKASEEFAKSTTNGNVLSGVMNKVAGTINRLGDEFRRTNIAAEQFADAMQRAADSEREAAWQASLDATRAQLSDAIISKRERQAEADNAFVGPRQQSPEEANAWRELARREAMTKEDRRSFRQQQREEKENFRKAADRKSRDEFREEQKKARERAFDDQKNGKFFDAEGARRSIREKNRAEAEQARKDGNQILKDIWTELKRLATA